MKIRNLIILLFVALSANAQSQKPKILYYNDQWVLTTRDSAKYYRVSLMDTAFSLFDGDVSDYSMDGKLVMKGSYKMTDKPFPLAGIKINKLVCVKEGLFTTYFPSGQIESQGEYKDDQRTGSWNYFYANGKPRYEVKFENDSSFFVVASYDVSGKQLLKDGTGDWQYMYNWFGETKRVIIQGSFLNGKKEGEWTCRFSTGEIIYKETFKNDALTAAEYAGASESEKVLYTKKYQNKIPPHFKFEATESFWHKKFLSRTEYPFLMFLKKPDSENEAVDTVAQKNKIFLVVEQPPEFPSGFDAFNKFVSKNLKYPVSARRMNIEGTVFVQYVIDTDGSVTDISIMKGISPDCDKEAMRVISLSPKWNPGRQSGRPVRVRFVYPVRFRLG